MRKSIKWALRISAFVLTAIVLFAVIAGLLFDPNDFKSHVIDFVNQETGHQLEIKGPVELEWLPSAHLILPGVKLSTTDAAPLTLFSATSLQLKLNWQALKDRQISIESLTLEQPMLNLVRDKNGQGNWQLLLDRLSGDTLTPATSKKSKADFRLALHKISLLDAQVHWLDKQAGKSLDLQHLNLSTANLQADKPALIRAQLQLSILEQAVDMDVSLSGELEMEQDFNLIGLAGMAMQVKARGGQLPDEGLVVLLAADLSVDLESETFRLDDFSVTGVDVHITGQLHGQGFDGFPQLDGRLVMQETNLGSLLTLLGINLALNDPQALSRFSFDIGLQQQGKILSLKPVLIKLDDSKIKGEAQLGAGDEFHLSGNLQLDHIDMDRYLGKQDAGKSGDFQLSTSIEGLRKLRLDIAIRIDHLIFNKMIFEHAVLRVKSAGDRISLSH